MIKLGMLGQPKDPINDDLKNNLLKALWNEDEPIKVTNRIQKLFKESNPSKEAIQDLFKFFKLKGLFKRNLRNKGMDQTWRLLLKENGLQGFMLEN
jgi:hypothetical protein